MRKAMKHDFSIGVFGKTDSVQCKKLACWVVLRFWSCAFIPIYAFSAKSKTVATTSTLSVIAEIEYGLPRIQIHLWSSEYIGKKEFDSYQ